MARQHLAVLTAMSALVALSFSARLSIADDSADLIKAKSLTAMGNLYVLPAEKEFSDGIKAILILKEKVAADAKTRDDLENKIKICKNAIQQWDFQWRKMNEDFTKLTDVDQKNNKIAAMNVLQSKIKEADGVKKDLETKVNALSNENREQYINSVIDMGTKADKALADYKELTADAKVKAALDAINETSKIKMRIGPSTEFIGRIALLKPMRGDVASETIPIKAENNVNTVEVTFNGTLTRSIILDTGAGMVVLTADLAEKLRIVPGPTDPTIHMVLADGKAVEGKLMILKSVRVGQFTVHDVECAVLPKDLIAAEPLLGGTFLKNFIVKIDPKAGELHLAAVQDPTKRITTGSDPKKDVKTP